MDEKMTMDEILKLVEEKQYTRLRQELVEWNEADIAAFLFKSKSPSCGLSSTPVFSNGGARRISDSGRGIFAKVLTTHFPRMIVGEELDLDDFLHRIGLA